jgi:hypothetical protein
MKKYRRWSGKKLVLILAQGRCKMAVKTLFSLVKHSLEIDEDLIKKIKRDLDSLYFAIKETNTSKSVDYLNVIEARVDLLDDDLQSLGVIIEAIEKEVSEAIKVSGGENV